MAIMIASATTLSLTANTISSEQVTGDYEIVGPGKITLVALGSATGVSIALSVGGVYLANTLPVPFFGTTGTMDTSANVVVSQDMGGGKVSLKFRNTTVGTLTVDYQLLYEPLARRR